MISWHFFGLTAVSTIIVTVSIVSLIIAKPVSNQRVYNISSIKTSTFSTLVLQNARSTTISTIKVTVSIIGPIITETISNNRGSKSSNTIFLMMTSAIRTVIHVDVNAALSKIKVTVSMVNLIIAEPVSN